MSNSVAAKGGWLKKLAIAGACLVVFLVIGFFYVTSASFLKSFILPRASQTMGATITVEDATISPFSEVTLRGLKVQTTGSEPLLQAQEVHAHYKLMDIIGGHINVSEAIITGPTVILVQNADGTSNLDPILKATAGDPNKPRKSGSGDKPTLLDVKNVELKNATVRVLRTNKDGSRETVELKNVNLTADQLKNGANTKLALATDITVERAGKTNDFMQAKFSVNVEVALDDKLAPKSAKAEKTALSISEGRGAMKDLAGLAAEVQIDWTPTEVKALGVKFTQSGKNLGEIRASGPFDPTRLEGKLKVEVAGIDRQVLSLAGGALGMDFGSTVLNTSNNVELSRGGQNVTINGQLTANRFSVSQKGQTTPAMDVQVNYALNVDQTAKTALVQSFTVNGTQNQKQLLRGALAKPMKLDWGKAGEAVDESSFDLAVSELNLAEWRAFTGESIQSGIANVKLGVVSQKAGRKLLLNTTASVENLSAQSGSNRLDQASVMAELRAQVDEFSQVLLQQASVKLTQQRDAVATATLSGTYDTKTQAADLQANLDGVLAKLVALAKVPDMAISSGTVKFAGKVSQKALAAGQPTNAVPDRAVTGQLRLENFTGQMSSNRLNQVDAIVDCDVSVKSQVAEIRKLAGSLRQAGQDAGRFEVTGNYQLANETGQFTVTLADLNQLAVGPFMAGALGDKTLKTISINSKTTASYDAKGQSSLNAELQVAKLVVHDPKGVLPETPLEVKLAANGTYGKNILDLKSVLLSLTPTARATNQVSLQGQLDMSKTNALKGNLAVTADSLDLTPYYDLFDHPAATNGKPAQASAPAPAGPANAEPAAMHLPVQSLVASVKVGRCYLREVAITNLATTLTITNNQILLNPMQFVLNGAPVNAKADINVGVAGYLYDISFSGNRIPLEPLANSFIPDKRGMYQGDIIANVQLKGAGVTGVNIKKNLAGQASFSFTNANIQIVGPRAKSILSPIAFVLNLPDVLQSPLNFINVQADIAQGTVKLKEVAVLSQAFRLDAPGTVVIADVLTNSTLNLPVDFSLRRSIAEKSNLLAANTPTNAAYAKLPNFAKITGTVGQPKTDTDKFVISGLLLRSAVSMPIAAGTKAGNIVQGVGNLLTGNKATNAAPATNVTDKPKINALDLLRNALEKDKDKDKPK